jgi:hypothetical protein
LSSIVGAITGGGSGGGAGMAFEAQRPDLMQPVTKEQVDQSYLNTQTGLGQQNDFLNAVRAQGGLANQSSVFNQQQAIANGTGPNPAQAMLANSTGANVANQAALMAGQRGSGANAGMMARQAANQGAGIQQNAAGQAAALQAQQSLGALNQMGGLATNQANNQANATNAYTNAALQQQANLLGGAGAYNNAQVGMQSNMNTTNASVSGVTAGAQGNMLSGIMGAAGSAMNMFGGGGGGGAGGGGGMFGFGTDMSSVGGAGMDSGAATSGLMDGFAMVAEGGLIQKPKKMAEGGEALYTTPLADPTGPQSNVGRSFMQSQNELGATDPLAAPMPIAPAPKRAAAPAGPDLEQMGQGMLDTVASGAKTFLPMIGSAVGNVFGGPAGGIVGGQVGKGVGSLIPDPAERKAGEARTAKQEAEKKHARAKLAGGGEVPALVSPGEQYLPPKDVEKVKDGKNPLSVGKKVPGTPVVGGAKNDYANDTVPAKLESGGIVIPRSITQSEDAPDKAAAFVRAVLAKQGLKPSIKGK